jgi:hypothetical protein
MDMIRHASSFQANPRIFWTLVLLGRRNEVSLIYGRIHREKKERKKKKERRREKEKE